jgi:transcriptional regulator with XRE-family HTH domain
MKNEIFSIRVRECRLSKKLSQKALGEGVGLSMQAINDIENNRSSTTLEKASLIADFLDVSLDYLVGRTDVKEVSQNTIEPKSAEKILTKEEELIIKNFRLLGDISKGKLIERSRILVEDSVTDSLKNEK